MEPVSNFPLHKGIGKEESRAIAEQRRYEENIAFLETVDLEELDTNKLILIREIVEDTHQCNGCESKEEAIKDMRFQFDMFIDELQHRLDDLRDIIPRNCKSSCEEFNRFAKKINQEYLDVDKKMDKASGIKHEYDLKIMEVDHIVAEDA